MMIRHINAFGYLLSKFEIDSDERYATLLELKSYYWLISAYYDEMLNLCDCKYKDVLTSVLESLPHLLLENGLYPDEETMRCDVCKILPCEIFSLLDQICTSSDQKQLETMHIDLEYHVFISWIYETFIGKCTACDACIDYLTCIDFACKYQETKNIHQLRETVYGWKKATNNDELWSCADKLQPAGVITSTNINLDGHVTLYLDFNVYNLYEKDSAVAESLQKFFNHEEIDIIYSGTHLEEILRMNSREYELKRIQSIETLTNGKIIVIDKNKKMTTCIEDIYERMKQVERYRRMNSIAEERACIQAEARAALLLHTDNENRDKAIGNSSLNKIVDNFKPKPGEKQDPNLPSEDELNRILRYVGITSLSIGEYKNLLKGTENTFPKIRMAITSMANLMNVIGLHGDKITNKDDANAKYPIYHQKSYRTIRSGYYDNEHLSFASKCTRFVTTDATLLAKAKDIYEFLGIGTKPISLDELMNTSPEKLLEQLNNSSSSQS